MKSRPKAPESRPIPVTSTAPSSSATMMTGRRPQSPDQQTEERDLAEGQRRSEDPLGCEKSLTRAGVTRTATTVRSCTSTATSDASANVSIMRTRNERAVASGPAAAPDHRPGRCRGTIVCVAGSTGGAVPAMAYAISDTIPDIRDRYSEEVAAPSAARWPLPAAVALEEVRGKGDPGDDVVDPPPPLRAARPRWTQASSEIPRRHHPRSPVEQRIEA